MHSGYFDNPEVKKKFGEELARYSPAGVHVDFQILQRLPVSGTIISETSQEHRYGKGAGRSGTFYIVRLDPDYRIHFRNLMKELRLQGDVETQRRLLYDFRNLGCIDENHFIQCYWPLWSETDITNLHEGLPVEFIERDDEHISSIKSTPGIISKIHKNFTNSDGNTSDVIELFLFDPISWMRAPYGIESDLLQEYHLSDYTNRISESTYDEWKALSPDTLPSGTKEGTEYVLDDWIELDRVKEFCGEHVEKDFQEQCYLGGAMFNVLPLSRNALEGDFRLMRAPVAREFAKFYAPAYTPSPEKAMTPEEQKAAFLTIQEEGPIKVEFTGDIIKDLIKEQSKEWQRYKRRKKK